MVRTWPMQVGGVDVAQPDPWWRRVLGWLTRLFRRPQPAEWVIFLPDGTGNKGLVLYQGEPVRGITALTIEATAGCPARLTLTVVPHNLRVMANSLGLNVEEIQFTSEKGNNQ